MKSWGTVRIPERSSISASRSGSRLISISWKSSSFARSSALTLAQ